MNRPWYRRGVEQAGMAAYWLGWPLWYLLFRGSVRTRVLVIADDHVLVVRSYLGSGEWGLPGGGLHRGEDPRYGATREVYEETGIPLDVHDLQPLGVHTVRRHGHHYTAHFFAVEGVRRPLRLHPVEIAAAEWLPLADAAQLPARCDVALALRLWADLPG